ncbi:MAG: hypothetical protein WBW59_11940, partial [Pseudolabrys sp.]
SITDSPFLIIKIEVLHMADVAVRGAELFSVKLPKAWQHNFSLSEDGFDLSGPCDQILAFASASHPQCSTHIYAVRRRKDKRGVDLISDALPFGGLWYGEPDAISNAVGSVKFYSRPALLAFPL